jgi:signal transduction histidine kinase
VVLLANPAAVACLEIPRTELLRSRLADRLAGGKALLQDTRAGEQRTAEIRVGPQRVKTVGFTSSRLSDQDHRVTVFRDLTPILEMQRRQRRAEQLAQVGEMAARLSHEIKNPLSSILAGLELLEKKTLLSFSQNAVLQSVCEEARALSEVVGELLRAARPAPMQPRLCRLGRTLYDAVEPLLDFAANHGIAVEIKPPQGDFCVAVDVQALGRVIRNLLVNAVEATAPGGRVLICWGAVDESEKKERFSGFSATVVKITVRDDGAGIPADLVERIFEPFCTTKENGTGLGLAVALDVVENHGGVMTVDSTYGVETAFSIYLTAGPRSSCWEHETSCRQSCASCPVRETSLGFCCWAIKGEGIWAETHHWPHLCQRCVYFRRYNLQAHFRR